jgi:hypothetical protein
VNFVYLRGELTNLLFLLSTDGIINKFMAYSINTCELSALVVGLRLIASYDRFIGLV